MVLDEDLSAEVWQTVGRFSMSVNGV